MEPTTTVATSPDGAGAPAQPAQGEQQPAATPQNQSPGQPAQTDDTAAWLQSKGVDPNDPEAFQKVSRMAYNSEKQMTRATQEASELKKSLAQPAQQGQPPDGQPDTGMQEFISDYRRDKLIGSFKDSHQDWKDHESAMVKILGETTPSGYTKSQLVTAGALSLEDIYAMAKASAPNNTDKLKAETQQEVLQTLANTQRAGGGTTHASNSNPQGSTEDPVTAAIRASRGK